MAYPTGTLTFLFTDIEGSTPLWDTYPEAMKTALAKHDSILKQAVESNGGKVIKTTGDGIHAVFETAGKGVAAASAAQEALGACRWEEIEPQAIRVRMGLHTGEAEHRNDDYYGSTLNRAARIMAAGHGGQLLLSAVTAELVRRQLPTDITLLDLGEHHLKGLLYAEHIFQLCAPHLASSFPALQSLTAPNHNLPAQLTTFIGRERELAETQSKLDSARLLTLIGPGGTGKTRLALEIAANQLDRFKDGVWLAELAPIADPGFVVSTIAAVFELHEVQGVPLITLLVDYLRAREALLVLDNCEHLVEASAKVADQLLHACPQLKIIASSREALGVDGETVYRVPSLSVPDQAAADLMTYEATRLFIERAAKAEPRFQATAENAAAIIQICQRLDGIPLAIELAAARIKLFTPEQIAARLDDRFKLLTGGSRSALPRQQTLRALIDWSHQSLSELEQRALRRLAVFSGGWTIEGAEAVIGETVALEGLLGLVNKSLVNVSEQASAARYRFLETIRQYAMEKLLETDEAAETRSRHVDYMLALAGRAESGFLGSQRLTWLDHMELEHDNLRAALEWASSNNPANAVQLALVLGEFWTSRDFNSEAISWCQPILSRSEGMTEIGAPRSRLYGVLAQSAIYAGNHRLARSAAAEGLVLANQTNDAPALVRLNSLAALASVYLGDFADAQHALQVAGDLARETGQKGELTMILVLTAQIAFYSAGDVSKAKSYLADAESLSRNSGSQWNNAMMEFILARLSGLVGEVERARALFRQSADTAQRMGNMRVVYSCHSELAHILRRHGELDEALRLYAEVLPQWNGLGHRPAVAHELECIAFILGQKGRPEAAVTLLGAADALRTSIEANMTSPERVEYDEVISDLRAVVDESRFGQSWAAGQSMSMDQAIELALQAAQIVA